MPIFFTSQVIDPLRDSSKSVTSPVLNCDESMEIEISPRDFCVGISKINAGQVSF